MLEHCPRKDTEDTAIREDIDVVFSRGKDAEKIT